MNECTYGIAVRSNALPGLNICVLTCCNFVAYLKSFEPSIWKALSPSVYSIKRWMLNGLDRTQSVLTVPSTHQISDGNQCLIFLRLPPVTNSNSAVADDLTFCLKGSKLSFQGANLWKNRKICYRHVSSGLIVGLNTLIAIWFHSPHSGFAGKYGSFPYILPE